MGFWRRARAFFADHGISVRAVLSDNGSCYRSQDWLQELVAGGAVPRRTRPYRPQTNGKVCEDQPRRSTDRSDPGKGLTEVSFVRSVDRIRAASKRSGRTDLT